MNLLLLKIDRMPPAGFPAGIYGLPEPAYERFAHCLVENPSLQLEKEFSSYEKKKPQTIVLSRSENREMHVRFSIGQNPDISVPSYIKQLFSEQLDQLSAQIKNYSQPEYLSQNIYGVDMNQILLMGIVNVTPDSFSDGGKYADVSKAIDHGLSLADEGAAILDVGGESSRPGADPVSLDEELRRVIPVVEGLRKKSTHCISVDTTKAEVAEQALLAGADWINDISALLYDPAMVSVIKRYECPVVIMHMQGIPRNMQDNPVYTNVCLEVDDFFVKRIESLTKNGIDKIVLDPGIGFGKRLEDNLDLIKGMALFRRHGYPLLYGTSRKSFIGQITAKTTEDRLAGSLASISSLVRGGVNILRVHDVSATKDFIDVLENVGN